MLFRSDAERKLEEEKLKKLEPAFEPLKKRTLELLGNVLEDVMVEILKVYPDIKAFFDCSAHGGGICQALKDKGRTDVKVVSLALPSMSANYIKDGSMVHGQAWRPADAGYATAYAAYLLVKGEAVKTGTDLKAKGYEKQRDRKSVV